MRILSTSVFPSAFFRFLCLMIFFFATIHDTDAQCFSSPGNPIGGSVNMGVLEKNSARFIIFYRYSRSSKFYNGDVKTDLNMYKAFYNYSGLLAGYGITGRLTFETEIGYFFNKTLKFSNNKNKLEGQGLSNAVFSLKYNFYNNSTLVN